MNHFRPLTDADARRLADRCWPGGADRTEPAALEWLRRWGPRAAQPLPLACECRAGRCELCN
jgi:hypothetical protein